MLSLAEFKPSAGRIFLSRRRPQICGLAEFKPTLLLSRPEIYSKPAWGSTSCTWRLLSCIQRNSDSEISIRSHKETYSFIHSFTLKIYIAPLQENSEALTTPARLNRAVLR